MYKTRVLFQLKASRTDKTFKVCESTKLWQLKQEVKRSKASSPKIACANENKTKQTD